MGMIRTRQKGKTSYIVSLCDIDIMSYRLILFMALSQLSVSEFLDREMEACENRKSLDISRG